MKCGQPVGRAESPGVATLPAKPKGKWPLVAIGVGAVILILLLLLLLRPTPTLEVRQPSLGSNLQVKGQAPAEVKMPQDVYDWLEHLRRIEERKSELTIKQMSDMKTFELMLNTLGSGIGQFDPSQPQGDPTDKEPADVTKGKFEDLKPQWEGLIKDYRSKEPPEECKKLADDYYAALSEIPGQIADLEDLLNQVNSDPQAALVKAQTMQNSSYKNIDVKFASADTRFQGICDKYHMKKWFNIGEKGSMFAQPSLGSGGLGGG